MPFSHDGATRHGLGRRVGPNRGAQVIASCRAAGPEKQVRISLRAKEIGERIDEDPDKMVPVSTDDPWKEPGFKVLRGTSHMLQPFLIEPNCADFASLPYEEVMKRLLKALGRPDMRDSTTSAA